MYNNVGTYVPMSTEYGIYIRMYVPVCVHIILLQCMHA